jgi:chromosome segregation ATPase
MAIDVDSAELRQAVETIREQNRKTATDNRLLAQEIRLFSARMTALMDGARAAKDQISLAAERDRLEIELTGRESTTERRNRRRRLLAEIQEVKAANQFLEDDIGMLSSEVVQLKRLNQSIPTTSRGRVRGPLPGRKKRSF